MSTILYLSNQLVQAVEMRGNKIHLVCQELAPENSIINGIITDEELFMEWIGRFFLKNKLSKKDCELVINSTQIHTRILNLPKSKTAETLAMITREFADIRTSQTVFTFFVLENDSHERMQKIFALAAERDFLMSYLRLFTQAGIEIVSMESAITRFIRRFASATEVQKNNCIVEVIDGSDIISMLFVKGTYLFSQRNHIFDEADERLLAKEAEEVIVRLQQFAASQQIEEAVTDIFLCGQNQSALVEMLEDSGGSMQQCVFRTISETRQKKEGFFGFVYPILGAAKSEDGLNFVRCLRQDSIEAEKKKERLHFFLPAICVASLCVVITACLCGRWISMQNRINRLQDEMETPEAVNDHAVYELSSANVKRKEEIISQVDIFWSCLMSYPTINLETERILTECAGEKVSLSIKSFNRDSGILAMSASADDARYITGFISQIQEQDIFETVEYSGYTLDEALNRYNIHVTCALKESSGR